VEHPVAIASEPFYKVLVDWLLVQLDIHCYLLLCA